MNLFLDSFWRALAYCLHPRVIAMSFLPLFLMVVLSAAGVYYFWETAVQGLQAWIFEWALLESLMRWLESMGVGNLRNVVAPLLVVMLALPVILVLTLLIVSWLMTPSIVSLVVERRFSKLDRFHGGSFWRSVMLGLGSSLMALIALVVSGACRNAALIEQAMRGSGFSLQLRELSALKLSIFFAETTT